MDRADNPNNPEYKKPEIRDYGELDGVPRRSRE